MSIKEAVIPKNVRGRKSILQTASSREDPSSGRAFLLFQSMALEAPVMASKPLARIRMSRPWRASSSDTRPVLLMYLAGLCFKSTRWTCGFLNASK